MLRIESVQSVLDAIDDKRQGRVMSLEEVAKGSGLNRGSVRSLFAENSERKFVSERVLRRLLGYMGMPKDLRLYVDPTRPKPKSKPSRRRQR